MTIPEIDLAKWGDRAAALNDLPIGALPLPQSGTNAEVPKPIVILITDQEIGEMTAKQYGPYEYNQYVLSKLKAFGAPVEGTLHLRLTHGAVARVKPDAANPQNYFQWMWLAEPYVRAIASAGRAC